MPIPGGSVDYFLVSVKDGKVKDFTGIEFQTLDTTGAVWPERQRFLKKSGVPCNHKDTDSGKSFGMNWKMTAKTVLMQMHHKAQTFEHIHKKLALVIQDKLLAYMTREFKFDHLRIPANIGDSIHIHVYSMELQTDQSYKLSMQSRLSTDTTGMAICLGLQADARVEIEYILKALQAKLSPSTLFAPI